MFLSKSRTPFQIQHLIGENFLILALIVFYIKTFTFVCIRKFLEGTTCPSFIIPTNDRAKKIDWRTSPRNTFQTKINFVCGVGEIQTKGGKKLLLAF